MSSDEQDDLPYYSDYAASEPGCSPQRDTAGKATRLTEAQRLRHDAIKHLNIDPITYPHTVHKKRHVSKKSLFVRSHDDISMYVLHQILHYSKILQMIPWMMKKEI